MEGVEMKNKTSGSDTSKGDSYWSGKRVFVTGATGFLGSWLTKQLVDDGAEVICLIRDNVPRSHLVESGTIKKATVVNGSLEDYWLLERALNEYEVDTVFHLGAQAIVGTANRLPISTFDSNIKGTWNMLEACRRNEIVKRIVVASSDKAYGHHKELPYTEEAPLHGSHPYDVSKSCTDLIAQAYHKTYGLPVGVTRCGNFYGGGDLNFNRIVPGTIKSVLNDENPIIRSDGKFIRDYLFIADAVSAYLTLGKNVDKQGIKGQAFNFGTENPISAYDLVLKIIKISGKNNLRPNVLNEARNEIKEQFLSSKKARQLLGWSHRESIESGIKKSLEWYRRYFNKR